MCEAFPDGTVRRPLKGCGPGKAVKRGDRLPERLSRFDTIRRPFKAYFSPGGRGMAEEGLSAGAFHIRIH